MISEGVYLGFDFGWKRIGVAVGQSITLRAQSLPPLSAREGEPEWGIVDKLVKEWRPQGLVAGIPSCIDGSEQYTTPLARAFADKLTQRYTLPVYVTDERLTTKEAKARLFQQGGFRQLQKSSVDSMAAVIILEQWLQTNA